MVASGSAAVVLLIVLGCSALRSVCSQDVNCRGLLQLGHAGTTAAPPVLEQQLSELEGELKGLELAEFLHGDRELAPSLPLLEPLTLEEDGHKGTFSSSSGITRDHGDTLEARDAEDTHDAAKVEHSQEAGDAEETDQHVAPNSSSTVTSIKISLLAMGSKLDKAVEAVDSLGSSIDVPTLVVIIASHVIIVTVILYCVWRYVPLPSCETFVHYIHLFGLSSVLIALQLYVFYQTGMLDDTWEAIAPYLVAFCLVCTCLGPICCGCCASYYVRWMTLSQEMHQMADALRSVEKYLGFDVQTSNTPGEKESKNGNPARRRGLSTLC